MKSLGNNHSKLCCLLFLHLLVVLCHRYIEDLVCLLQTLLKNSHEYIHMSLSVLRKETNSKTSLTYLYNWVLNSVDMNPFVHHYPRNQS